MIASFFYPYGANRNVKIFIGSDDNETRKEFSELCGNKKIKNFSVNTSITTSASSNTGASNQPLITMGMLERLNGNEKGNAIVSVRGYEPIWAVFTPSYELKHFYFSEDKKNTSKREARLFEKENYVFDIINKDGVSTYDKIIDEINKLDEDNVINEEYDINKLKELDKKWDEIIDDVNKRIEFLSTMLEKKDREKLIETRFEDKIIILYELIDKYDLTIAQKIEDLAEYISKIAMPELMELQNLATK